MNVEEGNMLPQATLNWIHEAAPLGIFTTDCRLRLQSWNVWLQEHSGRRADALCGEHLLQAFPELVQRGMHEYFERALLGEVTVLSQRLHGNLLSFPSSQVDYPGPMQQRVTIAPLLAAGQVIGVVTVIEDVTARVLHEDALRHQIGELEDIQSRQRVNSQHLTRELARERQVLTTFARSLLGTPPQNEKLEIATRYEPAIRSEWIGGDWYDFIPLPDGRLGFAIGDVCGKGLNAGVHTAMAKYTTRAFALEQPDPGLVVSRVNQAMLPQFEDKTTFISMVYGILDIARGFGEMVNAGHPAAVLVNGGVTEQLEATGPVLGCLPDAKFAAQEFRFAPGAVLALVTDGITEAGRTPEWDWNVADLIQDAASLTADRLAQGILDRALQPAGVLTDDAAVIVIRRVA